MTDTESFLTHHGILGQKWGVRRYQNEDGSLTEAGKKRQYKKDKKQIKKEYKEARKAGTLENNTDNRTKVLEKALSEFGKSKESKDFEKFNNDLTDFVTALAEQNGIKPNQIVFGKDDPITKQYATLEKAYKEKGRQVADKYLDEYAEASIKDINATDTAAARDFVKQKVIDERLQDLFA